MLTMDGYMLICTREAVIETADFLGGMGKSGTARAINCRCAMKIAKLVAAQCA